MVFLSFFFCCVFFIEAYLVLAIHLQKGNKKEIFFFLFELLIAIDVVASDLNLYCPAPNTH